MKLDNSDQGFPNWLTILQVFKGKTKMIDRFWKPSQRRSKGFKSQIKLSSFLQRCIPKMLDAEL
ncbi:hypothetical protein C7B76_31600 [filamentous cyanobacterium CCP2]|nr:hypothetical protein C7B76_31600 [filamentous cyanobacterium CCP2]